jgi:dienelactone hydrolase
MVALRIVATIAAFACSLASAQSGPRVVDVPARDGVTVRVLTIAAPRSAAMLLLLPGGHGGLQITPEGRFGWGGGNFLVRSRDLFVERGVSVAVVDAPSDRQSAPYLESFRASREHVADMKAVIAWARKEGAGPVWLVGTSRGTQSAAYVASQLQGKEGPDGVVLSSTIVRDARGTPVPSMPIERIRVPVLVVHHEEDSCGATSFTDVPWLVSNLGGASRKELITFRGGQSRGDPCEAFAHHGYNGQEQEVVAKIVDWIVAK